MRDDKLDLRQRTLDVLILKTLAVEPMHGFGITARIRQKSNEELQIEEGSLYPALHRLESRGWIAANWGTSDNNRRAKFYRLKAAGRKQLQVETENWERLRTAINLVLDTA